MVYATMDKGGLHVADPTIAEELERKQLSPSLITGLQGCPASWFVGSFVLPKFIKTDMTAAERGSAFHWVMEEFFKLPPEERTKPKIKTLIDRAFVEERFSTFFEGHPEQKKWLVDAIKSYYAMGADPQRVQIAEFERNGQTETGIEIYVRGKIGDAERQTLGMVDRVRVSEKRPDAVVIEDYKTGAKAKHWNPKTKSTEGLAEQRQQLIYTMLMENEGVKVAGASLIYPVAQEVVKVRVNDEALRKRVISDVEQTDRDLTTMISENAFEYNPNFCAWCPLAKICPKAVIYGRNTSQKVQDALAAQPEPAQLEEGIEFL